MLRFIRLTKMLRTKSSYCNQVNPFCFMLLNHSQHPFCQNFFADSRWQGEGIYLFVFHLLPQHVCNAHKEQSIISLVILHWELNRTNPQAVRCLYNGQFSFCLDENLLFLLCYAIFCSSTSYWSIRLCVHCSSSLSVLWANLLFQLELNAKHWNIVITLYLFVPDCFLTSKAYYYIYIQHFSARITMSSFFFKTGSIFMHKKYNKNCNYYWKNNRNQSDSSMLL